MQKNFANFNFGRLLEDLMGFAQMMKGGGSSPVDVGLEKMLKKMNLVTRAEFEAVKAMAVAARTQAEEVAEHVGMKKKKAAPAETKARKKMPKKTPKKTAAKTKAKTTQQK